MAQTVNGVTTYFIGNYYEVTGQIVTKYYYAGTQRIAMRQNGEVYYLLSDQLGSTSVAVDDAGTTVDRMYYSPWGEVRYADGTMPTNYTFTGQRSDSYINLLDYGSRRYDPELGRFIQPDSIVPGGVQGYDRYAYGLNNPSRFTDPTGHSAWEGGGGCTDESDCSASREDIISSIIKTGNSAKARGPEGRADLIYYRQLAIEMAIHYYNLMLAPNINVSAYSGSQDYLSRMGINLGYDPDFYGTGQTYPGPGIGSYNIQGTNIKIGERAFTSPGWLASTIGHENVHLQQLVDGHYYGGDAGTALNETEAYNWELAHASQNGLTDSEIAQINSLRQTYGIGPWNASMPGIPMPTNYLYNFWAAPTPTPMP